MMHRFSFVQFKFLLPILAVVLLPTLGYAQDDTTLSAVQQLQKEATTLQPMVTSEFAKQFLNATADLPTMTPRIVYWNRDKREAISEAEFNRRGIDTLSGFKRRELGEEFYYYTRYGTPLAYSRALDLLGAQGLKLKDSMRIVDFGFGGIGHLRLLASLGAEVAGIEVDPILPVYYSHAEDTGMIARAKTAGKGKPGKLHLHFGYFPADTAMRKALGGNLDVFMSKNTLKRGYIHPEREVDPKMLVHLGVDDSTYVATVLGMLKPGGYFMIYNLHPPKSKPEEDYIPWSDGRCPFDRALCERLGFEVIEYDRDDTEFVRQMGKLLGWEASMNLAKDLFCQYTLMRKR